MPLLGLHMTAAHDLAADLRSRVIDSDRGAFYLGATAPDIRVITRWDRARTHFFDLDDFEEQSGVGRLFEQEPALRNAGALDASTASFMAGYLSHLLMDEDYICQIYRPLFGERSDLRDDGLAAFMDRALQCELDSSGRDDDAKLEAIRQALLETAVEVNVGFIAQDTLREWRAVSVDVLGRPLTLERFIRRQFGPDKRDEADRFMEEDAPELVARALEHVGEERVRDYLSTSMNHARSAIKEYLS